MKSKSIFYKLYLLHLAAFVVIMGIRCGTTEEQQEVFRKQGIVGDGSIESLATPAQTWIDKSTGDTLQLVSEKKTKSVLTSYTYDSSYVKVRKFIGTVTPVPSDPVRTNISFESLGTEGDLLSKRWPVYGTLTSYGIGREVIAGRDAMRFEVRKGDPVFAGGVRAEVNRLSTDVYPLEVTYGISYYVPTDWVNDQPSLFDIVHQWHDVGSAGETEYKSPMDFSIDGTSWLVQTRSGTGKETQKVIGTVEKGKWVDFVFHIKFSTSDGVLEAWKDGVKVYTLNAPIGYAHKVAPFFKMGIYKWPWNPQDLACCGKTNSTKHVIYISNLRIGNKLATFQNVTP